ncbi:MAG: hypothetical protein IJ786_04365 [Bacteroidaceae bacterium]|nr:hypothetical protein [Bacteroidaceae bacterium]
MWVLLSLLIALGLITALLTLFTSGDHSHEASSSSFSDSQPRSDTSEACQTCAADGTGCYAERMLRHAVQSSPQYFEDEELDLFRHRDPQSYTPAEEAQFADVLYTLRSEEVADWLHSLNLRQIALPTALRDEAIALLQD